MSFLQRFARLLALASLTVAPAVRAQQARGLLSGVDPALQNRFLVVYRDARIPADAEASTRLSGGHILDRNERFGITVVEILHAGLPSALATTATVVGKLESQPGVEFVLHDRIVSAHRLLTMRVPSTVTSPHEGPPSLPRPIRRLPIHAPPTPTFTAGVGDSFYTSTPQQWAVRAVGGYGANIPGGPAHGPWDVTMGRGVRIAILDSGVDRLHPDIAPNLALNLSEIDQSSRTGLPSPCDDASPDDQQGHGTWTASLAAGALGASTGLVVGVAPQATLLNIKVLERMPNGDGSNPAAQCPGGQASGLLSWVLKGIDDAITQRADVISLSLGVVVDLNTGDGAGLKTTFDRVTHAAAQSGAVLIAAAGNDGFDLGNSRYVELPAQSRDVLAIVATTNSACAQNLTPGAPCKPGPVGLAYYSNYGAPLKALAAPGGSYPAGDEQGNTGWIRGACSAGKAYTLDGTPTDSFHSYGCFNLGHAGYVQAMGTSAAAPLAAGVAALLRAAHPTWSAATVVAAMRASAQYSGSTGIAQLNAAAALGTASR